jgi:hypothetical protein
LASVDNSRRDAVLHVGPRTCPRSTVAHSTAFRDRRLPRVDAGAGGGGAGPLAMTPPDPRLQTLPAQTAYELNAVRAEVEKELAKLKP